MLQAPDDKALLLFPQVGREEQEPTQATAIPGTVVPGEQQIRFCHADDGVRPAYATFGQGPPLVKAANWVTRLEFDWTSPLWRHWWEELGSYRQVIRYDERGLSDRDPRDLSLDAFGADLGRVMDSAGLDRFALLGISQGGVSPSDKPWRTPSVTPRPTIKAPANRTSPPEGH